MFILLFIYLATVFASTHEKYIDLLPEEEKREFLDRVARRLRENVQDKVFANVTSSDVLNDEQLNKHNDFVQTILHQESQQMRRSKSKIVSKNDVERNLGVKPLKTDTVNDKIDIPELVSVNVNVTKRRQGKHDGILIENSTNTNVDNDFSALQKRSEQVGENSESQNKQTDNGIEITEQKDVVLVIKTSEAPNIDTGVLYSSDVESTRDLQDSKIEHSNYSESTDNVTNKYDSLEILKQSNSAEITTFKSNEDNVILATETTTDVSKIELSIIKTQINTKNNIDLFMNKATEKNIIYIKPIIESSVHKQENYSNQESETSSEKVHDNPIENIKASKQKVEQQTSNTTMSPKLKELESVESHVEHQSILKDISTISSTLSDEGTTEGITKTCAYATITEHITIPTNLEHSQKRITKTIVNANGIPSMDTQFNIPSVQLTLNPKNIFKEISKKPTKSKIIFNKNPNENKQLHDIPSKPSQKAKFLFKKQKLKTKKEKQYGNFLYLQKKYHEEVIQKDEDCNEDYCKPYQVYEVPEWPITNDDFPIHTSPETSIEEPYYVSVPDYSPNKAYHYGPKNHYRPNIALQNLIELDTQDLLLGHSNKKNHKDLEFIIMLDNDVNEFAYNKLIKKHRKPDSEEYDILSYVNSEEYKAKTAKEDLTNNPYSYIGPIRDILHYNKQFSGIYYTHKDDNLNNLHNTKIESDDDKELLLTSFDENNILTNYAFDGKKNKINNSFKKPNEFNNFDDISEGITDLYKEIYSNEMVSEETERKIDKLGKITGTSGKLESISKLIQVTDDKDVFVNLQKMTDVNMPLIRKNNDIKIGIYLGALKDMVVKDSDALKEYDWLGTTVQIQSALEKLKILIKRLQDSKPIHPADIEILKYLTFLHKFSSEIREVNYTRSKLRKNFLPKSNKKHKNKEKGLLNNRVWLLRNELLPDLTDDILDLEHFLMDIEDGLYDLHEALKNIAMITKFKNQNWYVNLKDLYLTIEEKQLRELLLHLSVAKFFRLIEDSCENGLEEDFIKYMKTYRNEAKMTFDQIMFIIRILDEIDYKDLG